MTDRALLAALQAVDLAYSDPARARRIARAATGTGSPEADAVALRALGMAAAATGALDEAEAQLRAGVATATAAHLDVRAAETRGYLAYVLVLTAGGRAALRELDRADSVVRSGVPAARLQMQRGLVLSEIGRHHDAARALDTALRTLRRAKGPDLLEADIRNNRALAAIGVQDWPTARDQLGRAETRYAAAGHTGRLAMVAHNRGLVESLAGDVPAALAALDEAEDRYASAGIDPGLVSLERAEVLLTTGLVAEARAAATAAVVGFEARRNHTDLVQARLLLAECALAAGDPVGAAEAADAAGRGARRQGRDRWAGLAGQVAVRARWQQGERSPALLRAAVGAADRLAALGATAQSAEVRVVAARTALALGRTASARRLLDTARADRRRGTAATRAQAWHAEALLRRSVGDGAGAVRAVRAGLDVVERFRATLGASDLHAHAGGHAEDLARLGVRLALEGGRPTSVLAAADRGRTEAIRFRPTRPPDDAHLAADLAALRQVVADLRATDADTAGLRAKQSALERSVAARARHAAGAGGATDTLRPARLRTRLGAAILVEFVELDGHLHAVDVTSGAVRHRRLGAVAAVDETVDALRDGLAWLASGVGSARTAAAIRAGVEHHADVLDRFLFAGLATGDRPLVVVPTGALHALPWSALPTARTRAVTVAPSAALWCRAAEVDVAPRGRVVVAHGPHLDAAAAEVADISSLHSAAVTLTGDHATASTVLASLEGAGTAHLAAHGTYRSDNPMFSQLEFADGPLTVHDLERLTTPPRHVVLAACDVGRADVARGGALVGLTASLLAMGTVSLVAAVLPVPDDASRAVMVEFHRHRLGGASPAEALRRAGAGAGAEAHAFVCFGAG